MKRWKLSSGKDRREISKADYRQCLYSFYHPLVMALKPKICSDANRLQIVIRLEPGVCVTLARFPRQSHSAKKWKNIEFAGEKLFNWIKSERDENLRRANSRESNQNRSIFLFELSVIMRYTNIKNRLEHLSKHLYRVIYSKIIIEHFIRFTIIFKSSYRIYSM